MYSYDKPVRRLEREEIRQIAGEVLDALGVGDAGLDDEEKALFEKAFKRIMEEKKRREKNEEKEDST